MVIKNVFIPPYPLVIKSVFIPPYPLVIKNVFIPPYPLVIKNIFILPYPLVIKNPTYDRTRQKAALTERKGALHEKLLSATAIFGVYSAAYCGGDRPFIYSISFILYSYSYSDLVAECMGWEGGRSVPPPPSE